MKWTLCPVGSLLLAIAPMIAQGADVPTSYLVNLNALRASPAGTPFTFALYIDDACTTEVARQVVNVEDVEVIEALKQVTPSGATPAPPTARLTATLNGVTVGGNLYLTVTGSGIRPVGGACQVQAAQAAGHLPITRATVSVFKGNPYYALDVHDTAGPFAGPFGSYCLKPVDRQAVSVAASLDPNVLHTCDFETPISNDPNFCVGGRTPPCAFYRDGSGGDCILIFDITNCTVPPPTCTDAFKNQDETDVDCGGTTCPTCQDLRNCNANSDCTSGHCAMATSGCRSGSGTGKFCVPANCYDGVLDGNESDVDCGGDCPLGCATGQRCYGQDCDCARGLRCVCAPGETYCYKGSVCG
jgi:hypothetical protein